MKKPVFGKTIPTILGLLLLAAGIGGGYYLISKNQLLPPKSNLQTVPQNITISNISSDGFTVSWLTSIPSVGSVTVGKEKNKLDKTFPDYRNKVSGDSQKYTTHFVNVENLEPQTTYFFLTNPSDNTDQNNPLSITTGPTLGIQPPTDIIYGKVVNNSQQPVTGAIVYIELANASPISALTSKDGMWAESLHTARTADLNSYASYDAESSILTIKALASILPEEQAAIKITAKNDTPVPTIILGENKDYLTSLPEIPEQHPSAQEDQPSTPSGEIYFSDIVDLNATPSAISEELAITNPQNDGEKINTAKPQIMGKAPPQKTIIIEIQSPKTYNGTAVADSNGNWEFTPPENLLPGNHTVTASYVDENGQDHQIVRQFLVMAVGESDLPSLESTPSASASPSASPSPTPAPSPAPSLIPRISTPSTESGMPPSGNVTPTLLALIFGIFFIIIGFYLNFLPQKSLTNIKKPHSIK